MDYADIIDLPHHRSQRHKPMSQIMRAAQFAPFAALTGYDEAIDETARLTDSELSIADDNRQRLDAKIHELLHSTSDMPDVTIIYFEPDIHKSGGAYMSAFGKIKKIDDINHTIIMTDGHSINISAIIEIE